MYLCCKKKRGSFAYASVELVTSFGSCGVRSLRPDGFFPSWISLYTMRIRPHWWKKMNSLGASQSVWSPSFTVEMRQNFLVSVCSRWKSVCGVNVSSKERWQPFLLFLAGLLCCLIWRNAAGAFDFGSGKTSTKGSFSGFKEKGKKDRSRRGGYSKVYNRADLDLKQPEMMRSQKRTMRVAIHRNIRRDKDPSNIVSCISQWPTWHLREHSGQ